MLTQVIGMAFVLCAACANADPLVYVISGGLTGGGQFGIMDLTTGAFQPIGPGEPDGYFGLGLGPNGSLVSLTYAGNLDSIDPTSGIPTRVGPTGLQGCVVPTSSCGPTTAFSLGTLAGTIYATDIQSNLYTINALTGAATLLSSHTGLPASPFVPGSQNPDGTLNFVDEAIWESGGKLYVTYDAWKFDPTTGQNAQTVVAPALYQVDPTTGTATLIGPTDLGIGGATAVNGTTYALNDVTDQVVRLNLANGSTSFITDFDPAAGVIQGAAPVPEPGTIALAVFGMIGLAVYRWRRRLWLYEQEEIMMLFQHKLPAAGTCFETIWTMSACTLGIVCALAIPAKADSIAITYSVTGVATVVSSTDTTLTLQGQFSGSILSSDPGLNAAWNPVAYSDLSVADLTTGLLNGNFTFSFANGDMLVGNVFEDVSALVSNPTGTFTQTLTFTGGTGEFVGATGSVSGEGFSGTTNATASGSGTLNAPAVPEPASAALLLGGVALCILRRWRPKTKIGSELR